MPKGRKCEGCGAGLQKSDNHVKCLKCLGGDHVMLTCVECMNFSPQNRKVRVAAQAYFIEHGEWEKSPCARAKKASKKSVQSTSESVV